MWRAVPWAERTTTTALRRRVGIHPGISDPNQVLSLIARGGVIQDYGNSSEVAWYDKFFLGGSYDLRGFEERDVGPKDVNDIPLGGKTPACSPPNTRWTS